MNRFFTLLKRFLPSYRKSIVGVFAFNLLSTVLSLFSFAMIVPILEILFGIASPVHELPVYGGDILEYGKNLLYYYVTGFMGDHGQVFTLMVLSGVFVLITFLKVITYYAGSMFLANMHTGVTRDLRNSILDKILTLPMSFFSSERKGDIMSRLSVDVADVEGSIMGSLDLLVKNPLAIIIYLITLILISWQLTVFVLILLPFAGIVMGIVGKNLKKDSIEVGAEQGTLTAQIEETLGGMRIIKAFNAEGKIQSRFHAQTEKIRDALLRVIKRQYLAHPMSEFLGTLIISIVICFGGWLIIGAHTGLEAPVFIYNLLIF